VRDLYADGPGKASVKKFDELDPWQEEIDSDDEYYRSEVVKDKAGRSRVSVSPPFPFRVTSIS
jgi:hypothetical protein